MRQNSSTNIINISIIYKNIICIIMDNAKTVIKFMNDNLYLFEIQYDDVNRDVLKAAIAYKYLLHIYLNIQETIHEILKEQGDMDFILPKSMLKQNLSSSFDFT